MSESQSQGRTRWRVGGGRSKARPAPVETGQVVAGGCDHPGCESPEAFGCAYRDRRGIECHRAGCAAHLRRVEGRPYCLRHASVAEVLALAAQRGTAFMPPDLDNRIATLVLTVGRGLDAGVVERLERMRGTHQHVINDQAIRYNRADRVRGGQGSWDRSWALAGSTGHVVRITVRVEESHPEEVQMLVGRTVVAMAVPPWMHRGADSRPAPGSPQDVSERTAFYEALLNGVDRHHQGLRAEILSPGPPA